MKSLFRDSIFRESVEKSVVQEVGHNVNIWARSWYEEEVGKIHVNEFKVIDVCFFGYGEG